MTGTIMISQGTDGVSRGNLGEGVIVEQEMLPLCPCGKLVIDTESSLKIWM